MPRLAPALAALLVLTGSAFAVPSVARAAEPEADGIVVTTDARYTLRPTDGVVRVSVDVRARNVSPDRVSGGVRTSFFFDGLRFPLPDDIDRVRATDGGTRLRVRTVERPGYDELTVTLASRLDFRESATLTVEFDLVGGPPRSGSDVRVGRAFATFPVWAYGDTGDVEVDIPPGFEVTTLGDALREDSIDGRTILDAAVADTGPWVAWVTADDPDGLTTERLELDAGAELVIRAWPEDPEWLERVDDILSRGLPALRERIGLPWPVDGELVVSEVHSPLLEGYAGFYDPADDTITISEDLDDLTIVHEAAHAWFNSTLFDERWITEGLADEFAGLVLDELGLPGSERLPVVPDGPGSFPLNAWPPPEAIVDEDVALREDYGYTASREVLRQLLELTGEDGMRAVFAVARAETIAYPGADEPEDWRRDDDWRRFLDLLEEVGGAANADDVLERWVVEPADVPLLDERDEVRAAYAGLLEAGDGWLPPDDVRLPLATWDFATAASRIAYARGILGDRDELAAGAAALGLAVPSGLQAAYEGSSGTLADAAALVIEQAASLASIAGAEVGLAGERSPLTALGLLGTTPEADVAAAKDAWQRAEYAATRARAEAASAVLAAAPARGRERATQIAVATALALLLLLVTSVVVRGHRRSAAVAGATLAAPVTDVPETPGLPFGTEPVPAVEPEPPDASVPAVEAEPPDAAQPWAGGTERGDDPP